VAVDQASLVFFSSGRYKKISLSTIFLAMKKNKLAIIGLAAAVIVLSLWLKKSDISLPQAPPPSPQLAISFTGWQDVVNKEYSYSVKVPHDWSAVQIPGEPAYPQRMKVINVKPEEQQKPHVGIVITALPFKGQDMSQHPDISNLIADGREPKRLQMAGEAAMFFDNMGESGEEYSVFISHKNYVYRFDWTGTHPDVRKQYKDTGLKVLASLQFL
jgi:hypothetical protein